MAEVIDFREKFKEKLKPKEARAGQPKPAWRQRDEPPDGGQDDIQPERTGDEENEAENAPRS